MLAPCSIRGLAFWVTAVTEFMLLGKQGPVRRTAPGRAERQEGSVSDIRSAEQIGIDKFPGPGRPNSADQVNFRPVWNGSLRQAFAALGAAAVLVAAAAAGISAGRAGTGAATPEAPGHFLTLPARSGITFYLVAGEAERKFAVEAERSAGLERLLGGVPETDLSYRIITVANAEEEAAAWREIGRVVAGRTRDGNASVMVYVNDLRGKVE
jgi:hypothetical protein